LALNAHASDEDLQAVVLVWSGCVAALMARRMTRHVTSTGSTTPACARFSGPASSRAASGQPPSTPCRRDLLGATSSYSRRGPRSKSWSTVCPWCGWLDPRWRL